MNPSPTATQTNPASSATSVLLLAANDKRKGATIYNRSTQLLYVALGAAASTATAVATLAAESSGIGGYYEVPFGYTGPIYGIWASANGYANVTELT